MSSVLLKLAGLFLFLSLLAVGGGNGIIPAMQRAAVDEYHWMNDRTFLDLFAISRAAPGPGSLISTLVGQRAAGLPGALVATLALLGPSCILVHVVARVWHTYREASWREIAERGLTPIAVGLTIGSGLALMRGTEHGMASYVITAGATFLLALTECHPLVVLAAGGVAGIVFGL